MNQGLEGVVVAETRLSRIDGEAGELVVAGRRVGELVDVSFEKLCKTLLGVEAALGEARVRAFERLHRLGDALDAEHGMDALRAAIGHARTTGDDAHDAVALTGAMAVFTAAWSRRGQAPVAPDPDAPHAADFLRMLHGRPQPAANASAMNAYWCTVVDHGMNASTFAARVVASTESDLASAVSAALGALKGRLHGGAPGPVLDMLDDIGSAERADAWLQRELEVGRRIMGMGHRVYRVRDPRAAVLEEAARRLAAAGVAGRIALARAVEERAEVLLAARHPDRPLRANVEFYTAVLLEALGVPRDAFTPVFACGRVVGWCAHVMEQRSVGRLIRPSSRYVGPEPS